MKLLLCHNFYQQPGGEDKSFSAEADLLEKYGHEVIRYTIHNDLIDAMSRWEIARRTFWNSQYYEELRDIIGREKPDLMHCTNIFPLISPAAYAAARARRIPVVQSLRNYRMFCPSSYFLRNGRVCEDCLGKRLAWPGIVHQCYRESRLATGVVAGMFAVHRLLRTWQNAVDVYFTLTEFSRQKFIEGGLPAEKVLIKPNFIDPDPGPASGNGGYAVFVGRLSPEKGIDVLLQAWEELEDVIPLKIVGDGPLRASVEAAAKGKTAIECLGRRNPAEVLSIVGGATCLIMPSVWYETFGRTIIEAYSRGTPVVASRLGAMAEIVDDGRTGFCFEPGNPIELAEKVQRIVQSTDRRQQMRQEARDEYLAKYTAEKNIHMLISIYERALQRDPVGEQEQLVAVGVQ